MIGKKTKIICTIGPACTNADTLRGMIEAGMDVARFNFSHGTQQEQAEKIRLVQQTRDALGVPLYRPACIETTALGAAYLCGLAVGVYSSEDELRTSRQEDDCFRPAQDAAWRDAHLHGWRRAVRRALGHIEASRTASLRDCESPDAAGRSQTPP